jgi:hypothetical protein
LTLRAKFFVEFVEIVFKAIHPSFDPVKTFFELLNVPIDGVCLEVQTTSYRQAESDNDRGDLQCGLTVGRRNDFIDLLHIAAQFRNLDGLSFLPLSQFTEFGIDRTVHNRSPFRLV